MLEFNHSIHHIPWEVEKYIFYIIPVSCPIVAHTLKVRMQVNGTVCCASILLSLVDITVRGNLHEIVGKLGC